MVWDHNGDTRYQLQATVTANSAPVAADDHAVTAAGEPVDVSPLANDATPTATLCT